MTRFYSSPRWSGEILDCSMPMTFDTYSECSYRCLYCFAFFQKSIGDTSKYYLKTDSVPVSVNAVIRMFEEKKGQFGNYIKQRIAMQWGGMSDPFDENERKQGKSLELLKYFRSIEYPLSICTKGAWWSLDNRYTELFTGAHHINLKVSIITTDEEVARRIEVLCPSPLERLRVIERIAMLNMGGVTLRLRPFIIGASEKTMIDLIRSASDAGASAVSTEFMCLEARATKAKGRYSGMSNVLGFDVFNYYKESTPRASGYLRLNRRIKEPYILAMKEECDRLGLRFYVSDVHFKELCANGSCCGLDEQWNYSRGQFTEALLLAKKNGRVTWEEIDKHLDYAQFPWGTANGFNQATSEARAKFYNFSMRDWMRWQWNNVNGAKSPYKYFGGVLLPAGIDSNGDVIYEYSDK